MKHLPISSLAQQATLFLAISLSVVPTACAPDFKPASQLSGLRVLGVQKDKPYAKAGETVTLKLLWNDNNSDRAGQAPQIAWFALCENPASDLYALCFEQIAGLVSGALDPEAPPLPANFATRVSLPSTDSRALSEANDTFRFNIADDILSSRDNSNALGATPYGLTYVFFAVCGGTLGFDPSLAFPVICFNENNGEAGYGPGDELLSSEAFVVGYSAVYSYAQFSNANPIIGGMKVRGISLVNSLDGAGDPFSDEENSEVVVVSAADLCVGIECPPPSDQFDCAPELTLPSCVGDCPELEVRPLIDSRSAEVDGVASALGDAELEEQMWLNYYATGGSFESGDVKLLNDATTGWNPNYSTQFIRPDESGVHHLWAVAHDNRGGSQWARIRLCVE